MRLPRAFIRLPFNFDAGRLQQEVAQFSTEWRRHPSGYTGNSSLILVSRDGTDNDDLHGAMQPTPRLNKMPYVRQLLASLQTVVGRARLMRLTPGANVPQHTDINHYWRNHFRIHIPITTDPAVHFHCAGLTQHMAAGEAWTLDTWKPHSVDNPSEQERIHLVIDTVGSARLWQHMQQPEPVEYVPYNADAETPEICFESHTPTPVMHPAELRTELDNIFRYDLPNTNPDNAERQQWRQITRALCHHWQSLWMCHGPRPVPAYQQQLLQAVRALQNLPGQLRSELNQLPVREITLSTLQAAIQTDQAEPVPVAPIQPQPVSTGNTAKPEFEAPVFILAAPRSGSTLLFEALAHNRAFWTLGDESHTHFESIAELHPASNNYRSNQLYENHLTTQVDHQLRHNFVRDLQNTAGQRWLDIPHQQRPEQVRFLEKTPKNTLRIRFLQRMFPNARFIYLYRNPLHNISSLLDSWRSGRYVTYPELPGWQGPSWSHLLVPGWQALNRAPLADIATHQWLSTNQVILQALQDLPAEQWCCLSYEDFIQDPAGELQRLTQFAGVPYGQRMQQLTSQPLGLSRYTLSPPDTEKWRKNAAELSQVVSKTEKLYYLMKNLPRQQTETTA